ncbi:MAG: NUDIX hydrolase [Candidatus Woesebacteria bacterium]|jgi:8-oxo-dGTP pyrophosphatase MutT (NUDIX family)
MTKLKKWKLLTAEDISPSKYFPLEKRKYQLPNGSVIDNFYITTLADSIHIVPITKDGKVVMIRMYKQGVDDIIIQFPAGRFERDKHQTEKSCAVQELEEETGIKVSQDKLEFIRKFALMTTKATEQAHLYLVRDIEFNSKQKLDDTEEIEVLVLSPKEVDQLIEDGKIWDAPTITDWYFVKQRL